MVHEDSSFDTQLGWQVCAIFRYPTWDRACCVLLQKNNNLSQAIRFIFWITTAGVVESRDLANY